MKRNPCVAILLLFFFFTGTACRNSYQTQALVYHSYRVADSLPKDLAAESLLKPYKDEIWKTMTSVVGYADQDLERKALGQFMVDAYFIMAVEKYQTKIDAAFMNPGGIRLNQLPAGNITNGKIYELMPFDNVLVIQKLKGNQLQQFLDHTARGNGWPSKGIKMEIVDKKAVNVLVGERPLDPNGLYNIVNPDFVANGGDDAAMLKNIPQITIGYLARDALFDYIKKLKSQGINIGAKR